LLTLNGVVAAKDGVIIPVQCEYLALEGIGQLNQTLSRIRTAIFPDLQVRGVVMTMFDIRTKLSADVVQEINRHFPSQVFNTIIPRSVRLAEAPFQPAPDPAFLYLPPKHREALAGLTYAIRPWRYIQAHTSHPYDLRVVPWGRVVSIQPGR
jgi:chromosome partitioning protein